MNKLLLWNPKYPVSEIFLEHEIDEGLTHAFAIPMESGFCRYPEGCAYWFETPFVTVYIDYDGKTGQLCDIKEVLT